MEQEVFHMAKKPKMEQYISMKNFFQQPFDCIQVLFGHMSIIGIHYAFYYIVFGKNLLFLFL